MSLGAAMTEIYKIFSGNILEIKYSRFLPIKQTNGYHIEAGEGRFKANVVGLQTTSSSPLDSVLGTLNARSSHDEVKKKQTSTCERDSLQVAKQTNPQKFTKP